MTLCVYKYVKNFSEIILFSVAAALGALSRYGLIWLLEFGFGQTTSWGVFFVNMLGCLCFGFFWPLLKYRKVLLIAFMGSFTTFSTYIYDIYVFILHEAWSQLFWNAFMQIMIGFAALRIGLFFAQKKFGFSKL